MRVESSSHVLLCCEQASQVDIYLADLTVRAGSSDAVAIGWRWCSSYEVITLVRCENEQRVALIDAIISETSEEFAKSVIIRFQRGDIACLARAVCSLSAVVIVHIRDVSIRDWNIVFLHGCHIRERYRG